MITRDNLKDVLLGLTNEEVEQAISADGDYVDLGVSIFNAGSVTHIESSHYDEEKQMEADATGNLFIDKDDFLRISSEVGINWEQ